MQVPENNNTKKAVLLQDGFSVSNKNITTHEP